MISFIVPVYYTEHNSYIVQRARELIAQFSGIDGIELIIADASRLQVIGAEGNNIQVINASVKSGKLFSPAGARNRAAEKARGEYLFFFDVDLGVGESFLTELRNEVEQKLKSGEQNFLMFPCLYLSEAGTVLFDSSSRRDQALKDLKNSMLLGDNQWVVRLAVNTSAIVLGREYFFKIGCFCEDFSGHGGEDFELLHRLAALSPHSAQQRDYYTDSVHQFPARYVGFRHYLSFYSLPYLFTRLTLVHRWHPRPLRNFFYFKRRANESLLQSKMKSFDRVGTYNGKQLWECQNELPSMEDFINQLFMERGFDLDDCIGLHRYRSGVAPARGGFGNKIRKLLTRPRAFFRDSAIGRLFGGDQTD